eukprot:TRINITY_DN2423_c0_g1_i1.p1 TRINITY_DN2423_c0_g1~~TRINITY_DN2423_c0_g1_i1.p1  ORF type:complete len:271 (-),score=44.19 TRINITY_DN2423_c0_g1_i1:194-1006(-)
MIPSVQLSIALISGIYMKEDFPFTLEMLIDYLSGNLGCSEEQEQVSKIGRLIIAGNSMRSIKYFHKRIPFLTKNEKPETHLKPIQLFDELLYRLGSTLSVDVMPGLSDPATVSLPQQPFSGCLFPKSSKMATVNFCTNPYESDILGVNILGTSGENVLNMKSCLKYEDAVTEELVMERMLLDCQIAPTAPDLLGSVPLSSDIFVISRSPNVFFAGNQPKFFSKVMKDGKAAEVRAIGIPSFFETQEIVLLNLHTLTPSVIRFPYTDLQSV